MRTWAELVGLMDPMDPETQALIAVVLENAIDRIHHVTEAERNQLYLGLVKFLGIFMAEVLRLLALALQPEGDSSSLMETVRPLMLDQNAKAELPAPQWQLKGERHGS